MNINVIDYIHTSTVLQLDLNKTDFPSTFQISKNETNNNEHQR